MRGNKQLVRSTLSMDAIAHTNNREDDIDLHGSESFMRDEVKSLSFKLVEAPASG